jgi:superfamily II DNA or RNA helicase
MTLRDYQDDLEDRIELRFAEGYSHVMGQLSTGGGKTELIASSAKKERDLSAAIAHRQELLMQIANALARNGVHHRIIAPEPVVRFIAMVQVKKYGQSFVHGEAPAAVVAVDTVNARKDKLERWFKQVKLVQGDEGHHWLMLNKWGRAYCEFSNARGILWTATPRRGDRKSLLRGEGGICEVMECGPSQRWLMDNKYLSQYVVYGPTPSYNREQLTVGSDGDFTAPSVQNASRNSQIIGDILQHWFRLAFGERTLVFMADIRQAFEMAERFRQHGVRAVAMSAEHTDAKERVNNMLVFDRGELDVVVNVGLFGEGTDVPLLGAVCDGAATMSLPVFMQRLGRLLRPKDYAGKYIDHAGNYLAFVERHQCRPEDINDWSLESPKKRQKTDNEEASLKACDNPNCLMLFQSYKRTCPHCGFTPERQPKSLPEQVDGDLMEYTPELLRALGNKADHIAGPPPPMTPGYIRNNWNVRAEAQRELRTVLGWWGYRHGTLEGREDSEAWRLFYKRFKVDVLTCQTWSAAEATQLMERVRNDLG